MSGPGFDHITRKLSAWIGAQQSGEAPPWRFSPKDLGVLCLIDDAEMKQPGVPRNAFEDHAKRVLAAMQ